MSIRELDLADAHCHDLINHYEHNIDRGKKVSEESGRPYFDKYNWSRLAGQRERLLWIRKWRDKKIKERNNARTN